MESNWRLNLWRYGLCNLWEIPPPTRIARAYVRLASPGENWIWLREQANVACRWFVPPVVTTDYRVHVLSLTPAVAAVHPTIPTDFWQDQPLVMPWQGRIDPP